MKKKTKIFISGPMTGLKNFNYQSFDVAKIWLESQGYEVRSPAGHPQDWTSYEDYMTAAICMLEMCDQIAFLPGWAKSRGAKIEFAKSKELDIEQSTILSKVPIRQVLTDIYNEALKNNE